MFYNIFATALSLAGLIASVNTNTNKSMHYVEVYKSSRVDRDNSSPTGTYQEMDYNGTLIHYYDDSVAGTYQPIDNLYISKRISIYDNIDNNNVVGYFAYWFANDPNNDVRFYFYHILNGVSTANLRVNVNVVLSYGPSNPIYYDTYIEFIDFTNSDNWYGLGNTLITGFNPIYALNTGAFFADVYITYTGVTEEEYNNNPQSYNDGYNNGFTDGYSSGYTDGESVGYTDGFNAGVTVDDTAIVIFNGILNIALVPINFFLAIFNFEILGINMSALVSSLLSICLIIIVVRFVTGKKQGGD